MSPIPISRRAQISREIELAAVRNLAPAFFHEKGGGGPVQRVFPPPTPEKQETRRTNFRRHTDAACTIVYCISTKACYHTWVIFLH